jgi:hypothetical protein
MSTIERERRRRRIGENCEGDKSTITWGIEVYMVVLALKLESWGESGRIGGGREREKCYIHVSTICDLVFSIASDHASINFHFFLFPLSVPWVHFSFVSIIFHCNSFTF